MQLDGEQPSWQYPQGTNSHDAQAPVGEELGSNVGYALGVVVGEEVVVRDTAILPWFITFTPVVP